MLLLLPILTEINLLNRRHCLPDWMFRAVILFKWKKKLFFCLFFSSFADWTFRGFEACYSFDQRFQTLSSNSWIERLGVLKLWNGRSGFNAPIRCNCIQIRIRITITIQRDCQLELLREVENKTFVIYILTEFFYSSRA